MPDKKIKWPKVSIIVCTYNCKEIAQQCFKTLMEQEYPGKREYIASDGGSTDGTIETLKEIGVRILYNKEKLPEGKGRGKWLGYKNAKGKIIMIIDSDNFPIEKDWITKMIKPLVVDSSVNFCISKMAVVKSDKILNRYLSLVGPDPFVAYCSIDALLPLGKLNLNDMGEYYTYDITLDNFIITGGNYFTIKKSTLNKIGGYTQDIEVVYKLAKNNLAKVGIPKNATLHHLIIKSLKEFVKKKYWWAKIYFEKQINDESREYNWASNPSRKKKMIFITLTNLLLIPKTAIGIKMAIKDKESAWLLHPFISFITTAAYISAYISVKMKRKE